MSFWNIGLFTKWAGAGNRNEMAVALAYQGTWTDLGEQAGDRILARKALDFCTLVHGIVNDAVLTAIQADTHYLLLVRWEELPDGQTPSFDNRQSVVTTNQKNSFVTYFQNEFGINVAKVPIIANSVGRTREQVLRDIVADIRAL